MGTEKIVIGQEDKGVKSEGQTRSRVRRGEIVGKAGTINRGRENTEGCIDLGRTREK